MSISRACGRIESGSWRYHTLIALEPIHAMLLTVARTSESLDIGTNCCRNGRFSQCARLVRSGPAAAMRGAIGLASCARAIGIVNANPPTSNTAVTPEQSQALSKGAGFC